MPPEKGNETLQLLRDLVSRRVLVARNLLSSASGEIAALLEEVLAFFWGGIIGVISDKQESLCLAIVRITMIVNGKFEAREILSCL